MQYFHRGTTQKCVTSGGTSLWQLCVGKTASFQEMTQKFKTEDNSVFDLIDLGFEPQTDLSSMSTVP